MAFGDLVVLIPGISGSTLVKDNKEVWGTALGSIAKTIISRGESLKDLTITANDDPDLDDLEDGVVATRLINDAHIIPGLWKIDGYSGVSKRLKKELDLKLNENFYEFPYDWRRDNRVAARALARRSLAWLASWKAASGNPDAKLILVAHSMGGLIARHFLEVLDGWRETRLLITFGTPYAGSLKALSYISSGLGANLGVARIDLSEVLRSFNSVYQLLPTYKCVGINGKTTTIDKANHIANVETARVAEALKFHSLIAQKQKDNSTLNGYGYGIVPLVGVNQPTLQSAQLTSSGIDFLKTHPEPSLNAGGDGTVPRISAVPHETVGDLHSMFLVESHASLQSYSAALDHIIAVIQGTTIKPDKMRRAGPSTSLSLDLGDAYQADASGEFHVRPSRPVHELKAKIVDVENENQIQDLNLRRVGSDLFRGAFKLPQGTYRLIAYGDESISQVSDVFLSL